MQCKALSGLQDHVECTDSAQAVDNDIGQRALKIDDVELAVLWAITYIASCFKIRDYLHEDELRMRIRHLPAS